ncbi:MAG: polyphosphate polymerase domain-containing protein [Erysipelotrichia bacterium]|nr:polyphosphate polymerase domain-containing protein [Erysipelotrichia bacterium]NCC54521.1 polyphosphate polymerase domain-containing protein [Erysipelotrichia bacterium]
MKPTIMCMQRKEKKYLISKEKYVELMKRLQMYMIEDEYYKSTICNIYYDTNHYDLINTSLQKPLYKEKLRLRSYGVIQENDSVFLEIKKKCKGVVNKRRVKMSYKEVNDHCLLMMDTQISKEINYMLNFYKPEPKVFIAYDRFAYKGKEDHRLRITFDFNIRSRFDHLDLRYGDEGELLLKDGECLMEIKVKQAYPLWLSTLLSDLKIYPVSFSKYGRIYENMMLNEGGNKSCLQV